MVPPVPVIYFLVLLILFAVALIIHLNATSLSLPIQSLTIPTILFPLLAGLNTYLHSYLTTLLASAHTVSPSARRRRRRRAVNFLRVSTQTLQLIFGNVLATLLLQRVVPGEFLNCNLDRAWTRMWMAHDASGIRDVEEGLHCCGFRSLKDRAWPFPEGQNPDHMACASRLGYHVPCQGPWTAYMQRSAGAAFGVVVLVQLLSLANILAHAGYFSRQFTPWFVRSRPHLLPGADDPVRRPLLEDGRGGANGSSGRIIEEEESGLTPTPRPTHRNGSGNGTGAPGSIQPSGLGGGVVGEHSDGTKVWSDTPRGGRGGRAIRAEARARAGSKSSSSSSDSD
jgi:hypothetical protein